MRRRLRALLTVAAMVPACAAPDESAMLADTDGWDVARTCSPPPDLGRPESIDDVVALVDALPMPVTLPCVLEALERPLTVLAATSPFSAQATTEQESPRLFVFSGDLVISVVTIGDARDLLELGEYVEPGRTLKAEIEFPIAAPLVASSPFERPRFGDATTCSLCHEGERYAGKIGEVSTYTSVALAAESDRVLPIGLVEQYARDCDPTEDAARCAMLEAVFAHGRVVAGSFDASTQICVSP